MEILNSIFSYYDQLILKLPPYGQNLCSLFLLVFLLWQVYMVIKRGHWIFIALLIIMLPGTWPAAKHILFYAFAVIKFLFLRIAI